jgi:hypothetical protein
MPIGVGVDIALPVGVKVELEFECEVAKGVELPVVVGVLMNDPSSFFLNPPGFPFPLLFFLLLLPLLLADVRAGAGVPAGVANDSSSSPVSSSVIPA